MTRIARAEVEQHLLTHPDEPPAQTAQRFGLKVTSVWTYRSRILPRGRRPLRSHRLSGIDEIMERLTAGESYASIAQQIDVPAIDVFQTRLYRRGLTFQEVVKDVRYSTTQICALFGYARNPKFLARLKAAGVRFQCDHGRVRHGRAAYISADDLMRYLDSPENWHRFRIGQITDPDWRQYAQDAQDRHHLRGGAGTGPARPCERCGATHRRPYPHRWCRQCDKKGRL